MNVSTWAYIAKPRRNAKIYKKKKNSKQAGKKLNKWFVRALRNFDDFFFLNCSSNLHTNVYRSFHCIVLLITTSSHGHMCANATLALNGPFELVALIVDVCVCAPCTFHWKQYSSPFRHNPISCRSIFDSARS